MLEVTDLTVKYGEVVAVDSVSFCVEKGEIFGILGPNGAGKSSTIKAVVGLVDFEGKIRINGKPLSFESKNLIGYVPEEFMLIESLTPLEFFEFVASVRGVKNSRKIDILIDAFGIRSYVNNPIATLSMGTKQKVSIISALLHDPLLLILDEPLNGLDARSSRILKEIMQKHVERGGAVLFSTHIMEIAEKLCDRIAVINNGRIIAEGTVDELKELASVEGSLEDVFLKLTGQDVGIREIIDAIS